MYDHNDQYHSVRLHTVPARLIVIRSMTAAAAAANISMSGYERDII